MPEAGQARELSEVLDQLVRNTEGEKISVGDLIRALEGRSYGPLLLLLALVAISPIGAIPGMSLVTGTLIILVCGQMLVGREHPWLPERLLSLKFKRKQLTKTVDDGRPWVHWFEKLVHHRIAMLTKGAALYAIAIVSIGLAITFYPLALIPMGVLLPGTAIMMFALGVTSRDGLLVLIGYAVTFAAIGVLIAA